MSRLPFFTIFTNIHLFMFSCFLYGVRRLGENHWSMCLRIKSLKLIFCNELMGSQKDLSKGGFIIAMYLPYWADIWAFWIFSEDFGFLCLNLSVYRFFVLIKTNRYFILLGKISVRVTWILRFADVLLKNRSCSKIPDLKNFLRLFSFLCHYYFPCDNCSVFRIFELVLRKWSF